MLPFKQSVYENHSKIKLSISQFKSSYGAPVPLSNKKNQICKFFLALYKKSPAVNYGTLNMKHS